MLLNEVIGVRVIHRVHDKYFVNEGGNAHGCLLQRFERIGIGPLFVMVAFSRIQPYLSPVQVTRPYPGEIILF